MDHTTDAIYLATCRRFGIVPSAADYEAYLADRFLTEADEAEGDWDFDAYLTA